MEQFEYEKKKKRIKKEPIYIILCVVFLVVGSIGGYYFGVKNQKTKIIGASLYDEISTIIEERFLDTTESDYSLQERMLTGMVGALGDLHSSYLSSKQATDFNTSINGNFEGIGVLFTAIPAGGIVLDAYASSPADKAGMKPGDIMTHIEGTSIAGKDVDQIKASIQGEKGTPVKLQILRNGQKMNMTVNRGNVESSVNAYIDDQIGVLQITTFGNYTTDLVEKALKNFQDKKIETICVDLRNNGGGYLEAVKGLLDLFLPEDTMMFQIQDKKGNNREYKSTDCQKYIFDKGYILVNSSTASASEVMTAALMEQLDYTVIGEKTYGKGTAQSQATLSDGSVLKFTSEKWLTSKGNWINGKGIEPDYKVVQDTIENYSTRAFEKTYQYDDVSGDVMNLQMILKTLGYQVDRSDGYFSKQTENALKTFEQKYQLKVDGKYNQDDATILLSALSYHLYQVIPDASYNKIEELIK